MSFKSRTQIYVYGFWIFKETILAPLGSNSTLTFYSPTMTKPKSSDDGLSRGISSLSSLGSSKKSDKSLFKTSKQMDDPTDPFSPKVQDSTTKDTAPTNKSANFDTKRIQPGMQNSHKRIDAAKSFQDKSTVRKNETPTNTSLTQSKLKGFSSSGPKSEKKPKEYGFSHRRSSYPAPRKQQRISTTSQCRANPGNLN